MKWLLAVLALCWVPADAGTIMYSDSGTFAAGTASSAFSGSSINWAFAFQADTNPAVSDVGAGGFSFAFSNFSYSLAGSPVAITPTFVRFFSGTNGGGFLICFNGTTNGNFNDGLGTFGPQMYTGLTSAPTLIPGSFPQDVFNVRVNSNQYGQPSTTLVAATPEPSTLLTLAAGLWVLGGRRLHWRR